MSQTVQPRGRAALKTVDPVWDRLRREAEDVAAREPQLAGFIHSTILHLLGVDHTQLIYPNKGRPERIDQNEGHAYTKITG